MWLCCFHNVLCFLTFVNLYSGNCVRGPRARLELGFRFICLVVIRISNTVCYLQNQYGCVVRMWITEYHFQIPLDSKLYQGATGKGLLARCDLIKAANIRSRQLHEDLQKLHMPMVTDFTTSDELSLPNSTDWADVVTALNIVEAKASEHL